MEFVPVNKPVLINTESWLEENKQFFLPPVCNKMMHKQGQMKSFFVGGPNQRKDYHIERGEELFLQVQGDMILKVVEQGKHRDVHIREGQIFLLPGNIAHSPQRFQNTVGLVIERDRHQGELDGLRYFIEEDGKPTLESLYEVWFHCEDLGAQLGPVIKTYFASEQHKTGKPLPGTIPEKPPIELDMETKLDDPFSFDAWLESHKHEIEDQGRLALFNKSQFQVYVFGPGEHSDHTSVAEAWIWQWTGSSYVTVEGTEYSLHKGDSLLIPINQKFDVKQSAGCRALVCYQDARKSKFLASDTSSA